MAAGLGVVDAQVTVVVRGGDDAAVDEDALVVPALPPGRYTEALVFA